jgi:hypothetical protein
MNKMVSDKKEEWTKILSISLDRAKEVEAEIKAKELESNCSELWREYHDTIKTIGFMFFYLWEDNPAILNISKAEAKTQ